MMTASCLFSPHTPLCSPLSVLFLSVPRHNGTLFRASTKPRANYGRSLLDYLPAEPERAVDIKNLKHLETPL